MGRHRGVWLEAWLGNKRVACPRAQRANTAADTPALVSADELVVIPAAADPVGTADRQIAREQPITVGQCIRLVAVDENAETRHHVEMIGQRLEKILECILDCSGRLPPRSSRPKISMYIRRKDVVQQVPCMAVNRDTIE